MILIKYLSIHKYKILLNKILAKNTSIFFVYDNDCRLLPPMFDYIENEYENERLPIIVCDDSLDVKLSKEKCEILRLSRKKLKGLIYCVSLYKTVDAGIALPNVHVVDENETVGILNLKLPIDEEIYSTRTAFRRMIMNIDEEGKFIFR